MRCILLFIILSNSLFCFATYIENDSLLEVLDNIITQRNIYAEKKIKTINEINSKRAKNISLSEKFNYNNDLISQYSSFICDSAEYYIKENILVAEKLGDKEREMESKLRLILIYSMSGMFVQANEIFRTIDYDNLPDYLKILYCWNSIRYYENLIKYTYDSNFARQYEAEIRAYRDRVMGLLSVNSDEYLKEKAFKCQSSGNYKEALKILKLIFDKQSSDTHSYAMMAMGLSRAYKLVGDYKQEEKYLAIAAIGDIKSAIKENEALLSLAMNLYKDGDVDRAYNYIKVALDDAVFYNSRFKNTVIARVYPIVESTYIYKLKEQQNYLQFFSILISLFLIILIIVLYFTYKQTRTAHKAKRNLKRVNEELCTLNQRLDEANVVKEKYIGYFMNMCAVYVNKLDEYRKTVNRKIKIGQVDDLYKMSSRPFEKELEDLYINFDRAFLKLYPSFVEEFNSLLIPSKHYVLEFDRLNTELRIFALIRLGIENVGQISAFLHYSIQTIYNYKSKVKSMSIHDGETFEKEVRKLGLQAFRSEALIDNIE